MDAFQNKRRFGRFDQNLFATLLLVLGIGAVFLFASFEVNRITTNTCFRRLEDAAEQTAFNIRSQVESDLEELDVVGDLLSQHSGEPIEIIQNHLASFQQRGTLYAVGLLLPDSRFLTGTDWDPEQEFPLSFAEEAARIPYTSGVITAAGGANKGQKFIYHAVPLTRNGEVCGILYGFVDLSRFADRILVTAFDGSVQVYVADGATGNFLVDTWHKTLGNIFDESIMNRKVKPGYDYLAMKDDFVEGRTGHIAFWSNSAGEFFYSYYCPVGVNRWMAQITVPESIAFADARNTRILLYGVAAVEILLFASYFAWVVLRIRQETARKERQLAQSRYMYDVQRTLFDAHKDPALLTTALQKVAQTLRAECSFFLTLEGGTVLEAYLYSEQQPAASFEKKIVAPAQSKAYQKLAAGQSLLLTPEQLQTQVSEADRSELARYGITDLMLVPVLDTDEALVGILGCLNMRQRWADCSALECVSRNFQMALNNLRFYRQIEQMSMIDALTGLRNRNCYERYLETPARPAEQTLCCLYIDANGLHELNNTLGHAAGDAMLQCIGDVMRSLFDPQNCYRIGGDEFAIFCAGCAPEELHRRQERLEQRLDASGYCISIGEAWLSDTGSKNEMVAAAEQSMYEAKRLYYQRTAHADKARLMNQKLEHILREKKDSDAFLSILSSRFWGVYVVDMEKDLARPIYKPEYFADLLRQHRDRFLPTMEDYVRLYVVPEQQEPFRAYLDYNAIRRQLRTHSAVTFAYCKTDGTRLILRICPADCASETIWLFENDPG